MKNALIKLGYGALAAAVLALAFVFVAPQAIGQNVSNYFEQGTNYLNIGSYLYILNGGSLTVKSGGTITVASGGTLDVSAGTVTGSNITVTTTAVAAELNALHGRANTATFAYSAAGGSTITTITATIKTTAGAAIQYPATFPVWWSSSSVGTGVATASSGAWAATTGTLFGALTTKQSYMAQSNASGSFVLTITDSGKSHNYVCFQFDNALGPVCTRVLADSDYGT
jgi:hypothetical protein